MIEADFKWKSYVKSVSVKPGPKQYGIYTRGDKSSFRNYHRELKNGKGVTLVDILSAKIAEAYKQIIEVLRDCRRF